MPTPLLAAKLYIPPPRPNVVLRPRLLERLNAGLHRKLTLIAAPAGFGKTTLVASWIADYTDPNLQSAIYNLQLPQVAWLSLDEADSDPTRFLTYVIAALRTVAPAIGAGLLSMLQSPQPPPAEALLTALLNEISSVPQHFVLVLDDYHVIDARPIDDVLTFLLEHLPPQLHLVITTREDPTLPLARLRARSQLTELRAADLRFTAAEAAAFLNQVMGLRLSAADIITLEDRTEGWIAGLQLAALSMQGHQDVPSFIRAFAGDHRYIVDYLVEEVLQRQPESVRSFLLQTAILDRLSGSLCDAVTGQSASNARLEALERGNFFVIPLDDTRQWYRYHHLFADVIAAHLRAEQPDQVATLHRRASAWYAANGSAADAIRHALAAQDFARAADLVELALPAMRQSRQEATVLGWLKALPDDLLYYRPVLSAGYAGVLLSNGELKGVEERLRDAERWLDPTADGRMQLQARSAAMIVVDEAEFRLLPGAIAVFRAGQALALGNLPETVRYARLALDLVPEDDHLGHGAAAALLGLASWTSGDLEAAHRSYAEGMARLQMAGSIADAIGGLIALADIRIAQGRLHEAMRTYERGLQLAAAQHPDGARPVLRGTADMYVGMSELHREYDDLPAATQQLLRSQEQGEHTGFPQNQYRWRVAMARIRQAQGDLGGALELLQAAERVYVSDFFPNVRPIAALKTRVWLAQGRLAEALEWARAQGLSAQDELSYLREFEHITLARLLLARYQRDRADGDQVIAFLARLLQAADQGERTGSVIEILIVQALAHQAHGDLPAALASLSRALTLAEPAGYIRLFVEEGPAMKVLIARSAQGERQRHAGTQLAYIDRLLAAFPTAEERELKTEVAESPHAALSPQPAALVEPLSQRELAVLRLFKTELSGPQIAQELMIALSTVRTHTKSIYSKLNVTSRRAAVKRAAELDLL